MRRTVLPTQIIELELGVNLRRCDGFVPEELLHRAEISPASQHVNRVGMSQHVWAQLLLDPRESLVNLQAAKGHLTTHCIAPITQDHPLRRRSLELGPRMLKIGRNVPKGFGGDRHPAGLAALSGHGQRLLGQTEIAQLDRERFRNS